MNVNDFKLPGEKRHLMHICENGVHVASRSTLFCTVALYQMEDSYIEVFYTRGKKEVARMRVFQSTEMLAPYLKKIEISGLLK